MLVLYLINIQEFDKPFLPYFSVNIAYLLFPTLVFIQLIIKSFTLGLAVEINFWFNLYSKRSYMIDLSQKM